MEKKIVFFSKLPASIKEGFEKALDRDELESTTVSIDGESRLGVIYKEDDLVYLIIMGTPEVQDLEEDELDLGDTLA
jgi:hypothetical protein